MTRKSIRALRMEEQQLAAAVAKATRAQKLQNAISSFTCVPQLEAKNIKNSK